MRLGFWQKTAVFSTVIAVGLSGLSWFILHDVAGEEWSDNVHVLLTLHGVSSYALLVAVGSLLPLHVRSGWRRGRNIFTGFSVTATMVILSVTALMLYYGGEETQAVAKWLHVVFGFGCFLLFPAHAFMKARAGESEVRPAIGQDGRRLAAELGRESSERLSSDCRPPSIALRRRAERESRGHRGKAEVAE